MVHISLSPNLSRSDVASALSRLVLFWRWNDQHDRELFREEFKEYMAGPTGVYLFNSGRSALLTILKSLSLKKDDEVIIQAFTCNAVSNPILWAGAKPIYVDIDETFNIHTGSLEEKITSHTKVIIIQHTFGIPARIDEITAIAKKYDIIVIEDCAHALGALYKNKKVGTFGDIAFFSFGRDKIISSVYGGALIVNNHAFGKNIEEEYKTVPYPTRSWTIQQLLHPPLTFLALVSYHFGGKYLLYASQRLHLLSYAVTQDERRGLKPPYFATRLPGALAHLAHVQFNKLEALNGHRRALATIYKNGIKNHAFTLPKKYDEGSIFLRYPVLHSEASDIIAAAKKGGMILGDWYRGVVAPLGTHRDTMGYSAGSCQRAENAATNVINLPTNIRTSKRDAQKIVDFLNAWN